MEFKLSTEDYNYLRRLQKKPDLHPRRYRKVTVLIMLHQGYTIESIEQALGLDDNTISRYKRNYLKLGVKKFLKSGYVPYEGKLTEEQEVTLTKHLEENLYEQAASICDYVEQTFGVRYTESGMTKLLHRLGFEYKYTRTEPSKADEEKQVEFLTETLPPILEQVAEGQAVLYFADGCHPTHNTMTGKGWIKRGKEFIVPSNSGRKRVNINAATNALKPEHLVYDITDSINAQSTKRLLQQLLRKHPQKQIIVVTDNARYYKNSDLQAWIADKRINLVPLPAYSPNLNPIERLWRFMKKVVITSLYYDTYDKFRQAIIDFLESTKAYKSQLRALLTLNFRTVGGTSVYPQTTF